MIFTERKITISNNASSIDKQIVLYRGDKNVEIRFTISEFPFKYSRNNETNVIESTEASFGQLVIKTPNDRAPIFSDIVATKKGSVIFTITGEMIDEISELGTYDFQIRLFDDERNSRATIPPIEKGIEIREPIAQEDVSDTNEVGAATVGYALTTAASNEDAFDAEGNYNKTTWGTGDRITASKLNKIEAGIDGVNRKVAIGGTGGAGLTTEQAQQLSTAYQHSQTAHVQTSDIPTKTSQLNNDSNFVNETYVTNAINNAQLGGSGGDVDLSVGTLADTIPDNNLIDFNNLVTSFTNSNGGTTTGTFTNYIKIKAGQRYVTNLNYTQFYFFDANKNHTNTQTYLSYPQIFSGNGGYVLIKLPSDYSKSKVLEGTDIGAYRPEHIKLKSSLEDNKWYDKKWLCIGDSISTDESQLAKDGYAKLVSRELGMTLTNISVSGKTMKDGYEWLDNMSDEFDLITVMLGTNNQGYNCSIGSLNDSYYTSGTYNSNNSFYAQTQLMAEKLKTKFPKSVIIFLTPIKRTGCGGDAQYNDENGYFKKLTTTKEYRDVIIDVCNYYSLPYIDLYNCIDPRTEINRTLYFMSANDGTHPNDLGHALYLAPVVKDGIVKQCPYYFNDWTVVETFGDIVTDVPELSVNEGNSNTFTVSLDKAPTNDQTVNIASNNADVTVSPTTLTFTSENYNTVQTVTVNAAEDDDTVNDTATITLSSNGVTSKTITITITITDNDEPVAVTTYTVTNNLTNVTTSNSATSVEENSAYSATLTADTGYTLDTVTITMGGNDITSTVYSEGVITISAVTGNVVITASSIASEQPSGEAVLLHSWSGTPVEFDDNGTTRKMLEDTVGNLDLKPRITWLGNGATNNFASDRYNDTNFDIPSDISFTLKFNQYTRNSNYFSKITYFNSGPINGINISSSDARVKGRFSIRINSTSNIVYGPGTLEFGYMDGVSSSLIYLDKNTSVEFNQNETHDITLTFNADTKEAKLYQDTTLVLSYTFDFNLYFSGFNMDAFQESSIERIELYQGVVEPS